MKNDLKSLIKNWKNQLTEMQMTQEKSASDYLRGKISALQDCLLDVEYRVTINSQFIRANPPLAPLDEAMSETTKEMLHEWIMAAIQEKNILVYDMEAKTVDVAADACRNGPAIQIVIREPNPPKPDNEKWPTIGELMADIAKAKKKCEPWFVEEKDGKYLVLDENRLTVATCNVKADADRIVHLQNTRRD